MYTKRLLMRIYRSRRPIQRHRRSTRQQIFQCISMLIVPLVLGAFTIVTTFHQQKMAREQRLEDLHESKNQIQRAENYQRELAGTQYKDQLLVAYVKDLSALLEKYNGSLTKDKTVANIARAKTLNIFRQVDLERNIRIIRFLHEAGQLDSTHGRLPLDLSSTRLTDIDFHDFATDGKELKYLSLVNIFFSNVTLTKLKIQHTNFERAHFNTADFSFGQLENVNFSAATLHDTIFMSAKLDKVDFSTVVINNSNFLFAEMNNVSILHGKIVNCDFLKAKINDVDFSNANILNASFIYSTFLKIDALFVSISNVNFKFARLQDINLSFSQLFDISFHATVVLQHISFSNALMDNVTIVYTFLKDVDFSYSRIANAKMPGIQLQYVNLSHALLVHLDFIRCRFENISFTFATAVSTDFMYSKGYEIDFRQTTFVSSRFNYANLTHCNFWNSNLKHAEFIGASIDNVNFTGSNLYGADLRGSSITDNQLRSALSIHDALLPNGTKGHDENLIKNGDVDCSVSPTKDWILDNGVVINSKSKASKDDCRFYLQSVTDGASMYQRINLSERWDSTLWPYSKVILTARMSMNVWLELTGIDNEGHTLFEKVLNESNDSTNVVLKNTTRHLQVLIKFKPLTAQVLSDIPWCDNIQLIIEYGTHDELTLDKIFPLRCPSTMTANSNARWQNKGAIVAGGNGEGTEYHQLSNPYGLYVDDHQTVYIADRDNHRIMKWKVSMASGEIAAGGNGKGNGAHQLFHPWDVIVDKYRESLVICDSGNRRVVHWSLHNATSGETIIFDIDCRGLTIDEHGTLYIVDVGKHEVRRYERGDSQGTVIAGGSGYGYGLHQLSSPLYVFIDRDHSLYISDWINKRVMKWVQGAKKGIVVAGDHKQENNLSQLLHPEGVVVDRFGTVYVADSFNRCIMRWLKGATKGNIIINGNSEQGELNHPSGLAFDTNGNLYVIDTGNNRVQRFYLTE